MRSEFSIESRTEALDKFKFSKNDCCNSSFLEGFFFRENLSGGFHNIRMKTDVFKAGKVIKKLLGRYDIDAYVIEKEEINKAPYSKLYITEEESLERLYTLQTKYSKCDNCIRHFLIGLFVSDGVIYSPEKEYHLEFAYHDEMLADTLISILTYSGFSFNKTKRRRSYVVYTKNKDTITDFLATVGAMNAYIFYTETLIQKDINNRQNRINNFGKANTDKTMKAGEKVIKAIVKLVDSELLYDLPEDLQELAQLKLDNPTRSLQELGMMCSEPLTKSSVNRRLKKLCQIAQIEE